jgi:hypothetical protein
MITFLIYCSDGAHVTRTINDLVDTVPPQQLAEIRVCNDTGAPFSLDGHLVLDTNQIGRPQAWNAAAAEASGEILVFLRHPMKFSADWLGPILRQLGDSSKAVVAPAVHSLDLSLWATGEVMYRQCGLRWDMRPHNRFLQLDKHSPVVTSNLIAVRKARFEELGGFDEAAGEDVALSLRNWLSDGEVVVCDSRVATVEVPAAGAAEYAWLVETFLPEHASAFYSATGVDPSGVNLPRLGGVPTGRPIQWWLENLQPELLGVHRLRGMAHNRSVAVIGPGVSVDYIDQALVARHDLLVGVDYMGTLYDCDFVVTDSAQVVLALQSKYAPERFVMPFALVDRFAGEFVPTSKVIRGANQFDQLEVGAAVQSSAPPFCNFELPVFPAIQFALFLSPRLVTVFGCDNRIIGERSHTSRVEYYNDGKIWQDTDSTRRRLAFYEYGLRQLGELAHRLDIPLIRVSHA